MAAVPRRRPLNLRDLARGDWSPARTHPTLLVLQLLTLWQAALRGLDYVGGIGGGLDAAAADAEYGWLLYGSTVVVLAGLALRRAAPVILGHALLAAWYTGLGYESLDAVGALPGWQGLGALALSGAGVWLVLSTRVRLLARLPGLAAMLLGQALLVDDLGSDYRTGTALLVGGLVQATLAVGTFVLWQRTRLARVVDADP